MMEHQEIIVLGISYALVGAFIFTLLITCLSLVGWIKFADKRQQNRLFSVLTLELVAGCLALFFNFLSLDPTKISQKIETRSVKTHEQAVTEFLAVINPLADAYIDLKLGYFEQFFFNKYGPVYLYHWKRAFKDFQYRDYNPNTDFPMLYNDLVAEYLDMVTPFEEIKRNLRISLGRNVVEMTKGDTGTFVKTAKEMIINAVDNALKEAKKRLQIKISEYTP